MTGAFCVVSQEMPEAMRQSLAGEFTDVISLPPDPDLAEPVQCHPDMIFAVLDGQMFLSERYRQTYPDVVRRIAALGGFRVVSVNDLRSARYPHDVAFNIAVWRDVLICRPDAVCPALLTFAKDRGYHIVPVRQGYTGCSCLVTADAVLTFDRGIAAVCTRAELPCVLLDSGGIFLPGYDCGFLGGASGYYDGTAYLCGNAERLPCVHQFQTAVGRIVSLTDDPVTDYGGIKIFKRI